MRNRCKEQIFHCTLQRMNLKICEKNETIVIFEANETLFIKQQTITNFYRVLRKYVF